MAKILLVDDETDITEICMGALTTRGHQVTACASGLTAFLAVAEEHFDLIVTDIKMPRLDGIGLVEEVRGSAVNRHTPIIILSGFIDDAVEAKYKASPNVYLISKPFKMRELMKEIDEILEASACEVLSKKAA